jgi:RNA polymerase sigma-70 factor, ECF subfamily
MKPQSADEGRNLEERDTAFARIVQEHARSLFRVAWSVLRHAEDAEDAVQDALLKLYRGETWREMRDERAFLARVVWRTAADRRAMRQGNAGQDIAEMAVPDAGPSPEARLAEGDERLLLRELIETLPVELREPLVLTMVEEMNSREVASAMGLPEGTVRTRLMRAREQLRREFEARRLIGVKGGVVKSGRKLQEVNQ